MTDQREERFRGVFDACYVPLQAYARRRALPADADDLVAEVLMVAWRRLEDIPEHATLPWLYGVAHRTLANQRRSSHRRLRLVNRLASQRPSVAEAPDLVPVLDALDRLRLADRNVLELAAWEQLAPADIAMVLGCTQNAAALRLSRARRRLREQMTGNAPGRTGTQRKVTDA